MSSTVRQQKVARMIQKELSGIFQRDKKGIVGNSFISIAEVRMSPDLSVAKIYLGLTLSQDKPGVLAKLNARKSEIRKELGDIIRRQVRIIPELIFILDELEESAQRVEEIIRNLQIPPETKVS
ncbi:MAG: 30S ribosome-binding factor RbfA [Cyclobacteriaceae bacterium]|jgi:ribosome-binding factor A|nr:30S ribosome-binding factor RbfA [Cyclobacteriaceae bacterium]